MTRYPDWAARLEAYYQAHAAHKFKYGEWDCCHASLGAAEAITGVYIGAAYRGGTSRAKTLAAANVDREVPYANWAELVEDQMRAYGLTPIPAGKSSRGDLILLHGRILGVVALDGQSAYVAKEIGYCRATLSPDVLANAKAWRV
ncbi:MAG: hypothetical protein KGL39_26155 [Patescibacteria group bacterium]|nr:hypothetical protein [Patescibacteria group bacterium]